MEDCPFLAAASLACFSLTSFAFFLIGGSSCSGELPPASPSDASTSSRARFSPVALLNGTLGWRPKDADVVEASFLLARSETALTPSLITLTTTVAPVGVLAVSAFQTAGSSGMTAPSMENKSRPSWTDDSDGTFFLTWATASWFVVAQ